MKVKNFTFETSTGLVKMFEDISQTKGTPFVSGTKSNSTPNERRTEFSILATLRDDLDSYS